MILSGKFSSLKNRFGVLVVDGRFGVLLDRRFGLLRRRFGLLRVRFSFFAAEETRVAEEEIRVVEGEDSGC